MYAVNVNVNVNANAVNVNIVTPLPKNKPSHAQILWLTLTKYVGKIFAKLAKIRDNRRFSQKV
ncbi:hypothetical protein MOMA_04985 [Moraxella macacae 0408225]|uniref:Uncharacterized protein n=1 Tax=Moraxella macacae 0408225 TaxID=1230338 RepID=L2F9I3_9GAMM|nr:hypothetical protein MOMA_04985 [Moraxella macacae 0408225]